VSFAPSGALLKISASFFVEVALKSSFSKAGDAFGLFGDIFKSAFVKNSGSPLALECLIGFTASPIALSKFVVASSTVLLLNDLVGDLIFSGNALKGACFSGWANLSVEGRISGLVLKRFIGLKFPLSGLESGESFLTSLGCFTGEVTSPTASVVDRFRYSSLTSEPSELYSGDLSLGNLSITDFDERECAVGDTALGLLLGELLLDS